MLHQRRLKKKTNDGNTERFIHESMIATTEEDYKILRSHSAYILQAEALQQLSHHDELLRATKIFVISQQKKLPKEIYCCMSSRRRLPCGRHA